MFTLAFWLDFDVEELPPPLELAIQAALLLQGEDLKIKFFTKYKNVSFVSDHVKENKIKIEVVKIYSNGKEMPISLSKAADCWVFPEPVEINPPPDWAPSIVAIPDGHLDELETQPNGFEMELFGEGPPTRSKFLSGAQVCLAFSEKMASVLRGKVGIPEARVRTLDLSSANAGSELFDLVRETVAFAALSGRDRVARCGRPWSLKEVFFPTSVDTPEIFLFLPTIYPGGIWQASRDLISDLIEINLEKKLLKFTLGVPDNDGDEKTFRKFEENMIVDRFELNTISIYEANKICGKNNIFKSNMYLYSFVKGCEAHALRADAWFSLTDRFQYPLLPVRPYGVLIYDVIQKHAPETFPSRFFENVENGMKPTFQNAHFLLTGGGAVRKDVIDFYDVDPERVKMFPIATDPSARFAGKIPRVVSVPDRPFILQVTNMAPHKGVQTSLKSLASLKKSLGPKAPLFVICGANTELIGAKGTDCDISSYTKKCREFIKKNGLRENSDFVSLGFVSEEELLYLYQKASLVLNASRYDLGTLCALEAHYFGKPVVSSRYPAIEEMANRYHIPIRFFRIDDSADLADQILEVFEGKDKFVNQNNSIQEHLEKYNHKKYASHVYDLLCDLGRHGAELRRNPIKNR